MNLPGRTWTEQRRGEGETRREETGRHRRELEEASSLAGEGTEEGSEDQRMGVRGQADADGQVSRHGLFV